MRILHTSDLHLGRLLHNYSLLEDQAYILDQILELAVEHQADAIVVAGDLYDKSMPSAEAVKLLDRFLVKVADSGIPCLLTAGNHDSAERVAYGEALMQSRGIYLAPVLSEKAVTPVTLEDEYGPVDFYLLPFLKPANVRAFWPEAEVETDYTKAVAQVLRASEIDHSRRTVLVAHQFVTAGGIGPEKGGSETPTVGTLDNVDASVFAGFDYVALGHIHGQQQVGAPHIRYSGSPLKYSVEECRQNKCALLVELDGTGFVSAVPLPLTPKRDLRRIEGPLDELVNPAVYGGTNRDDYIHAVITDENPVNAQKKLEDVYPNLVKLTVSGESYERDFTGTVDPEQDPLTLFQSFYALRTGKELDEAGSELVAKLLQEVM